MKIKSILLAAGLLLAATSAQGQLAAGRVIRMSDFAITDMAQFSQYDYTLGSARSAAMGGAFVSLGADLSSMALNPAGLGMYRSSEFSFSPSLSWTKTTDRFLDTRLYDSPTRSSYVTNENEREATRFGFGNIGLALNLYQSTGTLTSLTVGFGYQKLADFNYRSNIGVNDWNSSIVDVFARQLDGTPSNELELNNRPWDNYNIPPSAWGAVAAWNAYGVDEILDDRGNGTLLYEPRIPLGALTDNMLVNRTRGYLGEFDIAVGMNFSNRLYFGLTVGIQDLYYRQDAIYEEQYEMPYAERFPMMDYMQYTQRVAYAGTGVNFKLGAIWRPIDALRIGLAVHSPTIMELDREYRIDDFYTQHQNGESHDRRSGWLSWRYYYTSPTRLMAGLSYQIGSFALLAADYERVWYNGMRVQSSDEYYMPSADLDAFKQDIKTNFQGTNNLRFGLEIKPLPELALRAGYALSLSPLSDVEYATPTRVTSFSYLDNPVITRSESITAGIGYRKRGFSLDLAYVNTDYKLSNYSPFWYDSSEEYFDSGVVSPSMKRGMVTLTMGLRF